MATRSSTVTGNDRSNSAACGSQASSERPPPLMRTLPAMGRSTPMMPLIKVDLPAPFGPTTAVMPPAAKHPDTDFNAG
ncbi:hypothetical protein D3C87_1780530 [compost metagenome]